MGTVHSLRKRSIPDLRTLEERLEISTKLCMRCRMDKPKTEFGPNSRVKDGLHCYCRSCNSTLNTMYSKERRQKDWAFRLLGNARTSTCGGSRRKKQMLSGSRPAWEPMDLTSEYLHALYAQQGGKCAYFNIPLLLDDGGMGLRSITLDRLNCERGYVQGNVALACRAANLARGNASTDDMRVLVEMIKRS